jgi:hypothetical protein
VVNFTPRLLETRGKNPQHALNTRLGGPLNRCQKLYPVAYSVIGYAMPTSKVTTVMKITILNTRTTVTKINRKAMVSLVSTVSTGTLITLVPKCSQKEVPLHIKMECDHKN